MPIAAGLRHHYRTAEWRAARARVMERAKGRCEYCCAPAGTIVLRAFDWWTPATCDAVLFMWGGTRAGVPVTTLPWQCRDTVRVAHFPRHRGMKWQGVQLGVAHLNHVAGDDREENLAALCRRCHLLYDGPHHRATHRLRRERETGQLRLEGL